MIHYSILIPERDAGPALERQVSQIAAVLTRLVRPYEIVVVDDGSGPSTRQVLDRLLATFSQVRVLHIAPAQGLSVALGAGIAAARGDVLVAMEAGTQYAADEIPRLISYLSRADLVFGHRRLQGLAKAWHRVARIPRWLAWGLDVRDPKCLFWAARREALADVTLGRGMFAHLPVLVRRRGFRVGEVYVKHQRGARSSRDGWPHPANLLELSWARRSRPAYAVHESPRPGMPMAA